MLENEIYTEKDYFTFLIRLLVVKCLQCMRHPQCLCHVTNLTRECCTGAISVVLLWG